MLWKQEKFDQARQTEAHIAPIADPSEYPETTMTRKLMHTLIEITDHKFDDAATRSSRELPLYRNGITLLWLGARA